MNQRLFLPFCLFLLTSIASCKLEPCKNFVCVNGEAQEDFDRCLCLCFAGWDGVDCSIEDKCVTLNVQCVNGYCVKSTGLCVCDSGYEGDSCQIRSRDRFLSANGDTSFWSFADTCGVPRFYDTLFINPSALNTTLEIFNIRNLDETQFVTVHVNQMTFEQRVAVAFGTVTIRSLKGTLSQDLQRIKVSYEASSSFCTGTWERLN